MLFYWDFFENITILALSEDIGYDQSLSRRSNIEYVVTSGFGNIKFSTGDMNIDFKFFTGSKEIPVALAVGKSYTNLEPNLYKFIENNEIEEGTFVISTKDSGDAFC